MVADRLRDLRHSYAITFHRYVSRSDENDLRSAYEIGRTAVIDRISLLELAEVHHAVLFDALRGVDDERFDAIARAASTFFAEVIATWEMTTRGFLERTVGSERE